MTETKQRRSKKPRKREPFLIDVTSPQYKEFQDDVALRTLYCEHTRRGEYLCGCCWLWGGSITWQGYAVYHIPKRLSSLFPPGMVTMSANRAAFLAFVQPYIAENFEIDHACHKDDGSCEPRTCTHRACVRPRHLTTMHWEHNRKQQARTKKTMCWRGDHVVTSANTGRTPSGASYCKDCRAMDAIERQEARNERARAKAGTRTARGAA